MRDTSMEIKIIALGTDDRPLDAYGQDGKSFAETYAPIVDLLLKESRLHAVSTLCPADRTWQKPCAASSIRSGRKRD